MDQIRVTAVSYLNTKPFLYGLLHSGMEEEMSLTLDVPSECARKLIEGEADLALMPVAAIPQVPRAHIVSDYCIGAEDEVRTVCVFAERPIEELTHLYLDYQSRTSVALVQLLLRHYWQKELILLQGLPGFERKIGGTTGALVIGDRTIRLEKEMPFMYDLAKAWKEWTGLPFVFAAWVANKPLPDEWLARFNDALALGIASVPKLSLLLQPPAPWFDLQEYFTRYIRYDLNEARRQGLDKFLALVRAEALVPVSSED